MDIEDRAQKAWDEYLAQLVDDRDGYTHWHQDDVQEAYLAGYLAGAAQAASDYSAHYNRERT